jgi:hypothetical protein
MVVLVAIRHFQIANGFLFKAATSSAPEASWPPLGRTDSNDTVSLCTQIDAASPNY